MKKVSQVIQEAIEANSFEKKGVGIMPQPFVDEVNASAERREKINKEYADLQKKSQIDNDENKREEHKVPKTPALKKMHLSEDLFIPFIEKAALNEGLFESADQWQRVESKEIRDTDGFLTTYTWYTDGDKHIFMLNDKEPDPEYADWECDSEDGAREWFVNYGKDEEASPLLEDDANTRAQIHDLVSKTAQSIASLADEEGTESEEDKKDASTIKEDLEDETPVEKEIPENISVLETGDEENTPQPPKEGTASMAASLLNALIRDEWEAIEGYNSAIVTLESEQDPAADGLLNVLKDIVNEENVHVGQLQKALEQFSPNAESIEEGADEAEEQLGEGEVEEEKEEEASVEA